MGKELIQIDYIKSNKAKLQQHAKESGLTLTALVTTILNEYIKKERL